MKLKLIVKEVQDKFVQENIRLLTSFIEDQIILQDWEHYDLDIDRAFTNLKKRHTIGAIPRDLIQTFKTGPGSITFNYNLFDNQFIDITTTGPCRVRYILGNVV